MAQLIFTRIPPEHLHHKEEIKKQFFEVSFMLILSNLPKRDRNLSVNKLTSFRLIAGIICLCASCLIV